MGIYMKKMMVKDYVEALKAYSNMPLDLSVVVEPFEVFVAPYDFSGVLCGIFIEDMLDQYAQTERIDIYDVLELVGFYANDNEVNTILHSLLVSTKHGACHSL